MTIEETIGKPWTSCLRLALEAAAAGSLAISSVITNASGQIISSGRNQLFDNKQSVNVIRNTLVSHAELNAIAGLPIEYRTDKSVLLYATVEPCPMCMGAIAMSSVKSLCIATKDPWAGAVGLLSTDRYMAGKRIKVSFESGIILDLFFYVNMVSQRQRVDPSHPFCASIEREYPDQYSQLGKLEGDAEFMAAFRRGDADTILKKALDLRNRDAN